MASQSASVGNGMSDGGGSPRKVLIIGSGFGGLRCARELSKSKSVHVTLIDRNPYQLFAPLLYQVATGGLSEDDIAYSVRGAIPGVDFRRGIVVRIDIERKNIRLEDGTVLPFDDLVLATGSTGATFGVVGVAEYALQMKTMDQARAIRNQLLSIYEEIENGHRPKEHLRVVVVGGGPTGVEVSGAVAELQRSIKREFPDLADAASVTLVEAGPRLLPSFTEKSSAHAKSELEDLGARVMVDAAVDRMYPNDVHLKSGEVLAAGTIVWAAGVAAHEEWASLGLADRSNRLRVKPTLELVDHVWIIGDAACLDGPDGRPLPMIAPVAMQMGRHVAAQIKAQIADEPLTDFKYKDKGQMATIGRRRAVVEAKGVRLHGTIAWMAWLGLHVFYLAGGRNRTSVVANWMWNYVVWGVGARPVVID
ncbi:MAG: NAD(P)/FAD-dependent oxidoreductase [Actinomycetota bacterium]|nr:NAD(P)/FAD-dependent oxidoreductase [Actinomycetota bacterium]